MPYIVPEGFFDKVEARAAASAGRIAARRRWAVGTLCCGVATALVLVFTMPFAKVNADAVASAGYSDEEILEIYDYDIFLNNY